MIGVAEVAGGPFPMGRVYLAGPMSGYPENNFPAFHETTAALRALGYDVVSPAEIEEATTWEGCLRQDIPALLTCSAVAVLPGWQQSRGATLETNIARAVGMPLFCAHTLKPIPSAVRGCGMGDTLDAVMADSAAWANQTFGTATPSSKAAHILREARELNECPTDAEEMADILLLLAHLADGLGVDLAAAARAKLEKNKARRWGSPDAEGVVEHIAEAVL